jgi:transketolase N-terminal domain/subunit
MVPIRGAYVMLGDGDFTKVQVWEAKLTAVAFKIE